MVRAVVVSVLLETMLGDAKTITGGWKNEGTQGVMHTITVSESTSAH